MEKPQVEIAGVWLEGNPRNKHLLRLAERAREGELAVGLVGMRFNMIDVSDGIAMGKGTAALVIATTGDGNVSSRGR